MVAGGGTERSTFQWHGHLARVSWAGRPCHEGFSRASDMAEGSFVAPALGVLHFGKLRERCCFTSVDADLKNLG